MKGIIRFILLLVGISIIKVTIHFSHLFTLLYLPNEKAELVYNETKPDVLEVAVEEPCRPRTLEELEGKKLIAFTFDDGPNNKTTLELVEGLKKYNARATFFVVGSRIERHKESLISAYENCNQIGNHTYSHYSLTKKSSSIVEKEIKDTSLAIYNVIGENPELIRTPYGSTNNRIKEIASLPMISWDIDTLDWKYRNENRIANTIVNKAHDGAIVLLHDLYPTSVKGALMAMEELKDEYAFVTIEEMMILKNVQIDLFKTYYSFK